MTRLPSNASVNTAVLQVTGNEIVHVHVNATTHIKDVIILGHRVTCCIVYIAACITGNELYTYIYDNRL